MWIQGLLDDDSRNRICDICNRSNDDLKLSDHFLIYPLHISFRRSFYTERFEDIRDDMKDMFSGYGKIMCGHLYPVRIKDMIWLRLDEEDQVRRVHEKIDLFLKEQYQIDEDTFDLNYHPHVTLFRDDSSDKLDRMYERISGCICAEEVCIEEMIIGKRDDGSYRFRIV